MVEELGTRLPDTSVGLWYGKPALKIAGKGFIHLGAGDDLLSVPCPDKDHLIAARPDAFRSTPHHDGTAWVLVDLAKLTRSELDELLHDGWRMKAPASIRKAHPEV